MTSCLKVFFSDGCTVYCSTRVRNVVLYANVNMLFMVDIKHKPPHITWVSMRATHLIHPYYFSAHLLTLPLMPRWQRCGQYHNLDREVMGTVWLQHDGAPAYFVLIVCDTLKNIFQAIGITVVHQHFLHYYPEHLIVLILPCQKTLYGTLKRNKQLCTILIVSCTRLWNRYLLPLCHTCFEACHKECGNIPGCILNIMVCTYSRST